MPYQFVRPDLDFPHWWYSYHRFRRSPKIQAFFCCVSSGPLGGQILKIYDDHTCSLLIKNYKELEEERATTCYRGHPLHQTSYLVSPILFLSCSILIVTRPCSVTNAKCIPQRYLSFLVYKFGHYRSIMLQRWSLSDSFFYVNFNLPCQPFII